MTCSPRFNNGPPNCAWPTSICSATSPNANEWKNGRESAICSILLLDEEGKHLLQGAAPSLPDFYNQVVHGLAIGDGVGSCGTAAFTKQRVIVEDVLTHPYWSAWPELMQRTNVRACWSQPFFASDGQILGTFAIYHREPSRPTGEDIARIETAANFVSLAVERKRSEDSLLRQTILLSSLLDSIPDIVFFKDRQGVYLGCNPPFAEFVGQSRNDIIGKTDYDLFDREIGVLSVSLLENPFMGIILSIPKQFERNYDLVHS